METSEKGWPALRSEYACRRSGKAGPPVGRPEEPSRMAASRSGFSLELTSPCSMMAARLVQNGPRNRLRSSARRCWCGAAGVQRPAAPVVLMRQWIGGCACAGPSRETAGCCVVGVRRLGSSLLVLLSLKDPKT